MSDEITIKQITDAWVSALYWYGDTTNYVQQDPKYKPAVLIEGGDKARRVLELVKLYQVQERDRQIMMQYQKQKIDNFMEKEQD
jgi:hypothetical protein